MQYIDKSALVAEIDRQKIGYNVDGKHSVEYDITRKIIDIINTLEVKEVSEELAETYMQVFEKKFPILPTLKGKRLDKFKNFLNSCRQIFGLQEFGIHPVQAKLFGKLALLWAAWGAENLQGIGQVKGESDVVKEVNLDEEIEKEIETRWYGEYLSTEKFKESAKHFFELGLKAQKGE